MHKVVEYRPSPANPFFEASLVEYRAHRPPKTTGNPYHFLGEPIGDLRDNMGCRNRDLSAGVSARRAEVAGVRARFYQPEENDGRPCIFFIHGGGFIGGSADVMENPCKYLAQVCGALVVNIDYRLAPETPYPGSMQDCLRVIRAVLADGSLRFDRGRVFVAGDSAGANLALACVQSLEPGALAGAILYYPVVDLSCGPHWRWEGSLYRGWPDELVQHCAASLKGNEPMLRKLYLQGNAGVCDPLVSPIYMEQAPACRLLLQYAEYDYLRPQAEAFAGRLAALGGQVDTVLYKGVNHAFLDLFGLVPQAQASADEVRSFVEQA